MTSWRAHYAAALYATGVPSDLVALALGDFVTPVSRQYVFQLLDRAGLDWRHRAGGMDPLIDAAIADAQVAGLVRRADIVTHVRARVGAAKAWRISPRITALTGCAPNARYIPLPGTPAGWRYCVTCQAFAPRSSCLSYCPAHYNERMRALQERKRRAAGVPSYEDARQRARNAVQAWLRGEYRSQSAAIKAHGTSYKLFRKTLEEFEL